MRAVDIVLPKQGTFTLNYPQDGVSQPASFSRANAIRKARATVTSLVKPNQSDAQASVNSMVYILPTTTTDGAGVVTVGSPLRLSIEVRVPSAATDIQVAAFQSDFAELIANTQLLAALFKSERLV